jgi:hypothetical protein
VHDGEAELALGQVFGEALIVGVLLQAQVCKVVTNLKKWCCSARLSQLAISLNNNEKM